MKLYCSNDDTIKEREFSHFGSAFKRFISRYCVVNRICDHGITLQRFNAETMKIVFVKDEGVVEVTQLTTYGYHRIPFPVYVTWTDPRGWITKVPLYRDAKSKIKKVLKVKLGTKFNETL